MTRRHLAHPALLLALFVQAATAAVESPLGPPPHRMWEFASSQVTFDSRFDCSRVTSVTNRDDDTFIVTTEPENRPINNSAWFAFKVQAAQPRTITVQFKVEGGSFRYRPKISTDGSTWVTLPSEAFTEATADHLASARLEVGSEPLWVAAQELVSVERMEAWMRTMERLPFVARSVIGKSALGHPLYKLDLGASSNATRHVSIIGRQHPPETTGSLALMRFVETLANDSELARQFRGEFHIQIIPLINPDGVSQGHWRHSVYGVDLNRDWDNFRQPETTAARNQILALKERGRVFLHLDFHSTQRDVFYTQRDEEKSSPAGFATAWIDGIKRRFPDYQVNRSASPTPTPNTSAAWAHRTLGIPGITYELGDETDRPLLQRIATGAAEEMMQLLLAAKDAPAP